jgi:ribosomal protein S18 acetylase RimI-like enzyme
MSVIIRRARPDDIDVLMGLWKEFIDFHQPFDMFFTRSADGHEHFAEFIHENLDNPDWLILIAEVGGEAVGYSVSVVRDYPPVFEIGRYGFVQDIAVTESHRRAGVGSMMLEDTLNWFRTRDVTRAEVHVAAANPVSQAFWRKHGFGDYVNRLAREI